MQRLGVGLTSVGSTIIGSPSMSVGPLVGLAVGDRVGEEVGRAVVSGSLVGLAVGDRVGDEVGRAVATSLGFFGVEKSSSL